MRLTKSIRLAFNILKYSKLRSWLSIVGIIIGVASVIAILALGEGMQQNLEETLGTLGADIITVSKGGGGAMGVGGQFRRPEGGGRDSSTGTESKNLTNREVQALKTIPNIDVVQGVISERGEIIYLSETTTVSVEGVDPLVWKEIEVTELDSGRYLSQGDKTAVVIGYRLATETFDQDIQLNRQITIEGKPFRVVGILEESTGFGGGDNIAFIPIDTARMVLEDVDEKSFDSIEIKIKDVDLIDETLEDIENKLMMVRAVTEKTKDFSVSSAKATQETISSTINSMVLFLSAIAAISLLVGSVGIANTMFTTVLEKTKEIGIMKSVGAKNKDILTIFIFNSGMIGLAGGVMGGVVGILISSFVPLFITGLRFPGSRGSAMSAVVTPQLVIGIVVFSILIGIISGIIPAYRASRKNPVDALRYE